MTRHRYGISALVTQTSFCEGSGGDLARLFSQAKFVTPRYQHLHASTDFDQLHAIIEQPGSLLSVVARKLQIHKPYLDETLLEMIVVGWFG